MLDDHKIQEEVNININMAGFNLSKFKSEIDNNGFMKSNHGQLIFSSPKILQSTYPKSNQIILRADRFSMPGVWLTQDDEVRRYGYGPVDRTPHLAIFDPFDVEFITDEDGFVVDYINKWINGIINFDSTDGMLEKNGNGAQAYEHSYKEDYLVDMYVRMYKADTNMVLTYRMSKCWPLTIGSSTVSWSEQNNIIRLPVRFVYKEWKLIRKDAPTGNDPNTIVVTAKPATLIERFLNNSVGVTGKDINNIQGIL